MTVKYHSMTVGELVKRVNRGDKVEITNYPPFGGQDTEDMRYINIEAYGLDEIKEACQDAFGDEATWRYEGLVGALRARRRVILESPIFTATKDGGWEKVPHILQSNVPPDAKGGDAEHVSQSAIGNHSS